MKVSACGASHRGNIRTHNEDNIYVDGAFRYDLSIDDFLIRSRRCSSPYMYAVFDGLGGESCGEQASLIAALGIKAMEDRCIAGDIDTYINAAHKTILKESIRKNARNMGTTIASLRITDDQATVFNVGDSRVYLFRDNRLIQLSKDHSIVQSLIDNGLMKEEERFSGRFAGELTQYIGMVSEDVVEPAAYVTETTALNGDIFLLCSDGLNSEISDTRLSEFMECSQNRDAEHIATMLISRAVEGACRDNVSVVVCKCEQSIGPLSGPPGPMAGNDTFVK